MSHYNFSLQTASKFHGYINIDKCHTNKIKYIIVRSFLIYFFSLQMVNEIFAIVTKPAKCTSHTNEQKTYRKNKSHITRCTVPVAKWNLG